MKDKSILIKNIFYMLSYYYLPLSQSAYANVEAERFENIHNLLAAILTRGINRQIKRGLCREYINRMDNLEVLRGKINIPGTIRNHLERRRSFVCEFDELTANCLFNQIIRSAMILLLRHEGVEAQWKMALKRTLGHLFEVDDLDLGAVNWARLQFYRNNADYRLLLGICRLLAEGLLLTTEEGNYRLASFFKPDQMNRLFEKFILAYFAREHPQLGAKAPQIPWAVDDDNREMLPNMQSDIVLADKRSGKVLIIDAKYYGRTMQSHFDLQRLRSAHLYQIFTYVKNMALALPPGKPVAGLVLYARTDEKIQPDNRYQLSGNEICLRTLDLNCDFSKIRAQLDGIAESLSR